MLEKEAELALTNNELAELEEYQVSGILFVALEGITSIKKKTHIMYSLAESPQYLSFSHARCKWQFDCI